MSTESEFHESDRPEELRPRRFLSFVFWRNLLIGLVVVSPLLIRGWLLSKIPDIPEPFDVDAFCRVEIAPGQNAFDHYREAYRLKEAVDLVRKTDNNQALWDNYDEVAAKGWSVAEDPLKKWLEDYRATLIEWRRGTECSDALYIPLREMDFTTAIPVSHALREIARVAQCDATRLEGERNFEKSGQLWVASLRCSRHVGRSGFAVERLTGRVLHHWATQGLNRWGASSFVTKEMLSSVYQQVRDAGHMSQPVSSMLKADYIAYAQSLNRSDWVQFDDKFVSDPDYLVVAKRLGYWIAGEPLAMQRLLRQILANQLNEIDKPLPDRQPFAGDGRVMLFQPDPRLPLKPHHLSPTEIDRALQRSIMPKIWTPQIKFAVDVIARERAQQVTIELALLLQIYRRDHGEFPERLSDVIRGDVDEVPVDPCDKNGKPIRYRRDNPHSAIVWSVGPDGNDDGGEVADTKSGNSIDVGFVLNVR